MTLMSWLCGSQSASQSVSSKDLSEFLQLPVTTSSLSFWLQVASGQWVCRLRSDKVQYPGCSNCFTVAFPVLHHLSLMSTAIPSPLHFPLYFKSLSALNIWKLDRDTLELGICSCSHVSVKHVILHCQIFRFVLVSASSVSILFAGVPNYDGGKSWFKLPFSLFALPLLCIHDISTSTHLGSQLGYCLASWYLD